MGGNGYVVAVGTGSERAVVWLGMLPLTMILVCGTDCVVVVAWFSWPHAVCVRTYEVVRDSFPRLRQDTVHTG